MKISGLYAVSQPAHAYPHDSAVPFLAVLLDRFGPNRLYWGSDFAPSLDEVSFRQTLDLPTLAGLGWPNPSGPRSSAATCSASSAPGPTRSDG
ncbi:hypothetical protein GCM10027280_53940 [Micromonospora polyrhachis]|uniref:Amidohydrolase-related domain-containing protein n=1 Tax=Micromonospora polyrhachis TaxID=1282883 RepID=A0A7W7SK46_9ACTN|nr:amidohydrolase family protein [Micromonospora polyrhachis]MBB4956272.1 hypothetical protein [Micromonospora polyrhachis]